MSLKHIYLILTIVGAALPLSQFIPWLLANGLDIPLFFKQLLATPVSRFFAFDVVVSALVLFTFILVEGKRLNIQKYWVGIVATLCVGVSVGLPLFLYQRQAKLDSAAQN
ncbi:DUF2834 domain-containing protein [Alteromonas lipolytica]|uniref:DUF2834 domain-containing protein n=1 Tax=Alteromonas lipolytica TaxID=1856405 RepID=A0A1E8FFQ0_9ALTE|nr:DUF2834 domain-containing protein [Alteromonas lipolytica]OFI34729.1 hypothetical protein BFC17_14205 [Alteromonas lipolytica]GGF53539.1 hypothetical protein GCM10011338_02080 [Alteromonas lipolytica]